MASSIPIQIAETIQTASIKHNPDPAHDLNPSTAASEKEPVSVAHPAGSSFDGDAYDEIDEDEELDGAAADDDDDDIPYDVIRPVERQTNLPPLPDLRFEQSYLASIANADTNWKVAYITLRDQLFLPLAQGTLWGLALHGWRFWNKNAQLSGTSVGARVRRWWYKTNNWPIHDRVRDIAQDRKVAAEMGDFYRNKQGTGFD